METNYIGPQVFRKIIDNLYSKIKNNYIRQFPKIIVGPFDITNDFIHKIGFENFDKYKEYLDERISIFIRFIHGGKMPNNLTDLKKEIEAKSEEFISKLVETQVHYQTLDSAALYSLTHDAIFLSPYDLFHELIESEKETDMLGNFEHELVHYDIADVMPLRHLSDMSKNIYLVAMWADKLNLMDKVQMNKYSSTMEFKEAFKLFSIFSKDYNSNENHPANICKVYVQDVGAKIMLRNLEIQNLNINLLDEATAYCVAKQKDSYAIYLKTIPEINTNNALTVYDEIGKSIQKIGIKKTIKFVKNVINQSYKQKINALNMILSNEQ